MEINYCLFTLLRDNGTMAVQYCCVAKEMQLCCTSTLLRNRAPASRCYGNHNTQQYKQMRHNVPSCFQSSNVYINDDLQEPGFRLVIFSDGTCVCDTGRNKHCVVIYVQQSLTSLELWWELWVIKIKGGKTPDFISIIMHRRVETRLALNEVNSSSSGSTVLYGPRPP
jgi:hypothetical protein